MAGTSPAMTKDGFLARRSLGEGGWRNEPEVQTGRDHHHHDARRRTIHNANDASAAGHRGIFHNGRAARRAELARNFKAIRRRSAGFSTATMTCTRVWCASSNPHLCCARRLSRLKARFNRGERKCVAPERP